MLPCRREPCAEPRDVGLIQRGLSLSEDMDHVRVEARIVDVEPDADQFSNEVVITQCIRDSCGSASPRARWRNWRSTGIRSHRFARCEDAGLVKRAEPERVLDLREQPAAKRRMVREVMRKDP